MFTRVRTFIAQLIPPDRLVPVYVRRAQSLDKQSFTFQADTLLIDLVVADKTKGALVKKLEGVLIGDIPERSQMNLWQNNQLFATAILDPGGDFIFDDLYPGIYELVVNSPTQKIYIPALVIS